MNMKICIVKKCFCFRCVVLACAWISCSAGSLFAELKTHNLHGVSSLTIDKKWVLRPGPSPANEGRFAYPSIFEHELDPDVQSVMAYVVVDLPLNEHVKMKHEKFAERSARYMASGVSKEGEKITLGEFNMRQPKELGKICRYFEKEVIAEDGEKLILFGAVWKTDTRCYCLLSALPEAKDRIPLMKEFLGGWKELETLDEVHADSYRSRNKFLTKEQKKKLREVTKSEWLTDLELRGMADHLEKKEDPVMRRKYEKMRIHSAGRKMRLIYYKLLTEKQKKDFDQSVKKRLEAKRK